MGWENEICAFARGVGYNEERGGIIEYNGKRYRVIGVSEGESGFIDVEWIDEFREAVRAAVEK